MAFDSPFNSEGSASDYTNDDCLAISRDRAELICADGLPHILQFLQFRGMDAAEPGIYLTPNGVQTGDYLHTRQPEILLNDPLPEDLLDIRTELRHFAQERSRTLPGMPESEWIKGRIDDLRHLENSMKEQAGSTVYIQSGPGGRLNVNSTDNSVNVVSISEGDVFPRLRQEIEANVIDPAKRQEIVAKLDELEQSRGTPTYAARFRDFIAVTADIVTIIGPFIQPLTTLIK